MSSHLNFSRLSGLWHSDEVASPTVAPNHDSFPPPQFFARVKRNFTELYCASRTLTLIHFSSV